MHSFPPVSDNAIAYKYGLKNLEDKIKNKTAFQSRLGWPAEPKMAMFCLPAGMTDSLGGKLLKQVLPGLLSLPIELVIVGKGTREYGEQFTKLAEEKKHRIAIIPDKPDARNAMYASCDGAIFFSDPSGLKELKECLKYGVVPVSPACKHLEPYDPIPGNPNTILH